MPNLNYYLNKDLSSGDVSHSNGMGSVAGGGGAGGLSMDRRRELLNKPRVVDAYHHSRLGRLGPSMRVRTADQKSVRSYDASSDTFVDNPSYGNRQRANMKNTGQINTKSVERRQRFIEPPSRKFDKYG